MSRTNDVPKLGDLFEDASGDKVLVIKEPAELPDCGCRLCVYWEVITGVDWNIKGKKTTKKCISPFPCASQDRQDNTDVIYILWEECE